MRTLKKLALLPLLFCGLLATVACDRNNENDNNENGDRLLPSKVFEIGEDEYGSGISRELFFYDDQNRIIRFGWYDSWVENGESGSWASFADITYNADGTIAKMVFDGDWESTHTFTYSGNTVTRIRVSEDNGSVWRDTSHFEINDRGQLTRRWSEEPSYIWETVFIYNANGSLTRIVDRTTFRDGETEEWTTNVEYSPTVRAVFRNTATPGWFFQFYSDHLLYFPAKHGFMPTRWWSEDGNWQYVFTYSVEDDWVRTMTIREEENGSHLATKGMRTNNRLGNDRRFRQDTPRRTAPATKSNGDNHYSEWTLHFEYVDAR